jgi:ornithine cyclodeaminase/alanine dehydrogenase
MKPKGTLFLRRSEVATLADFPAYVDAVEGAFRSHAEGRSLPPQLMHVDSIDGEFHIKAGGLHDPDSRFAIKINGSFFQNRTRHNMPNIQGVIVISDASHGYPLCVMDSMEVTIQRTGAATAVAARRFARPDSETATICGVGNQGRIQLKALTQALPIRRAFAWDVSLERSTTFASAMSAELGIPVSPFATLSEATAQSDVIVTCTPAKSAFLMADAIRSGTFIAAVGCDSPDKQELDPNLLANSTVVADLIDQVVHVGDTHHAIKAGLMTRNQIHAELGEVLTQRKPARSSASQTIIFDSTGTALQDVAAAAMIYKAAQRQGLGTVIDLAS